MWRFSSHLAVALLTFIVIPAAAATAPVGTWKGAMVRSGVPLPVSVVFTDTGATFSSPRQRALDIPLRNVRFDDSSVHFELVGDVTKIIFEGKVAGGTLAGTFTEGSDGGQFSFTRTAPDVAPYKVEEVRFANGNVTLSGSFLVPDKGQVLGAVIFLHGSGAEGRYASQFVADQFARAGIAALIYDKRGVAKSTGDWRSASFADLVEDANAGVQWLSGRNELRGKPIGVYGHSQGGLLAPFLATRSAQIKFVVSGAGSAVPLREAEVHSITNQLRRKGVPETDMPAASAYVQRYVDALASGAYSPEFGAETERVKGAAWFPLVHVPAPGNWFWTYYSRIASYDATEYWRRVKVPALVLYGEADEYVPVRQSVINVDRALQTAGNQDYTIILLPRASHAFNIEPAPGGPFEWSHVAPGFPDVVVGWVVRRIRTAG
jgi:alpha-beta hydrolase superfamily lysophospholipase